MAGKDQALSAVRIDKWLWAARCFKTRSKATAACNRGQCKVDGKTAKPGLKIKPGVSVEVHAPGGLRILQVMALADRRGPASVAATLYEDHSPPPPPKPDPIERLLDEPVFRRDKGAGRPTKRDRRRLDKTRWQD